MLESYDRPGAYQSWQDINPQLYEEHPDLFDKLKDLYGSLDNVDLYVGGMLESYDRPGPLFRKIIKEQFERIRDSDRFWFENTEHEVLTEEEVDEIKSLSLADIIKQVTSIADDDIQNQSLNGRRETPALNPYSSTLLILNIVHISKATTTSKEVKQPTSMVVSSYVSFL